MIKRFFGKPFAEFTQRQEASGIILITCTVLSLILSNVIWSEKYLLLLNYNFDFFVAGAHLHSSPVHFINDALMAVFFLLVGLEIKRELISGELSTISKASLPVAAALGGMIVPALIYAGINMPHDSLNGWGIPMATDIAFALGVLSLLGKRVPLSLKVLLTALAVVDDLGTIVIIALFYTKHISAFYLLMSVTVMMVLYLMNYFGINKLRWYIIPAMLLWVCIYLSGVHATIAGVLLALFIPLQTGNKKSLLLRLEHMLHKPVNFIIMPLFALVNTAIVFDGNLLDLFNAPLGAGVIAGLVLGKPIGISVFVWLAVKLGLSQLPEGVSLKKIIGVGFLGGIGFTMSIFISLLAFEDEGYITLSKISIMIASLIAGIIGYAILRLQPYVSSVNQIEEK